MGFFLNFLFTFLGFTETPSYFIGFLSPKFLLVFPQRFSNWVFCLVLFVYFVLFFHFLLVILVSLGLHSLCIFLLGVGDLMSLAVGLVSSSKNMGLDDENAAEVSHKTEKTGEASADQLSTGMVRSPSEGSLCQTEEEDDDDEVKKIELGPQFTLKEQIEKDADDESLRRWKEQLLGSVDVNSVGETLEPEVKIMSLAIKSPGRSDIILPIPMDGNPKGLWFTLKEGSRYSLEFMFQVSNNIVSGLKYTNTVWKTAVKVDSTKEMLGTFSPQSEPYTHVLPEDTTPSGIFARGSYSARSKFADDDNKCFLEINYTFDIRKDWQSS